MYNNIITYFVVTPGESVGPKAEKTGRYKIPQAFGEHSPFTRGYVFYENITSPAHKVTVHLSPMVMVMLLPDIFESCSHLVRKV